MVSAPTRVARMTSAALPLTVAPTTRLPGVFISGQALAGEHQLVNSARAIDDDAVSGYPFSWAYENGVANVNPIRRDVHRCRLRPAIRPRRPGQQMG